MKVVGESAYKRFLPGLLKILVGKLPEEKFNILMPTIHHSSLEFAVVNEFTDFPAGWGPAASIGVAHWDKYDYLVSFGHL